jgi:tetratricopeptide (TPR) repeat protein
MAIDPYSTCRGGTGKKLKFCCSDLLSELEKIERMLQGEQFKACLEFVDKLEKKYPGRACLVTTKARLEGELEQLDESEQTLARFLGDNPRNPVALALTAINAIERQGPLAAIPALQRAIEASREVLPADLIDAVMLMGQGLLQLGKPLAARQHLLLALAMDPANEAAETMVLRLNTAPLPLVYKDDLRIALHPTEPAWKQDFDLAVAHLRHCEWQRAAEAFARLAADKAPQAPAVWRNLAIAHTSLADNQRAAAAWHKLATLDIPLDDAAEAEALAQVLEVDPDDPQPGETVALLDITYPLLDMEKAIAVLTTEPRCRPLPIEAPLEEGQPPPRAGYELLDRPMPEQGIALESAVVPRGQAQLLLFGRQTDREARLELVAWQDRHLDSVKQYVTGLLGPALGQAIGEHEITKTSGISRALQVDVALPPGLSPDQATDLLNECRRSCLDELGRVPLRALGGRTAEEVRDDPAYRVRLLGLVLRITSAANTSTVRVDDDELRRRWGLPVADPIRITSSEQIDELPIARLTRVVLEDLSDKDLARLHMRGVMHGAVASGRRTAQAIVSRESMKGQKGLANMHGYLAETAGDSRQSLRHIEQARDAAVAAGESSASWDLSELRLRALRGEAERFGELLEHIGREHIREPGVRQAMTQLLFELGFVDQNGDWLGSAAPAPEPVEIGIGAAVEPGKIWTPEAERGGEKKGLWLPGMS